MICAQGSRFGGFTMFVKDGELNFVYNFLGIEEQRLVADAPSSGEHIVGVASYGEQRAGMRRFTYRSAGRE